jgi:hypothetical protein
VNGVEPFIISSTMLASYKECKKQAELGFFREGGLEPKRAPGVMDWGIQFHKMAEWHTRTMWPNITSTKEQLIEPEVADDVRRVYWAYWDNKGSVDHGKIRSVLGVEAPLYVPINVKRQDGRPIYFRATFDKIFLDKDGWIIGHDYKTFKKQDAWDVELDFQGRIYTAVLKWLFPDRNILFEYDRVRQDLPKTHGGKWLYEECYEDIQLVCSPIEIVKLWKETEYAIAEMCATENFNGWYRQENKFKCKMCRFKELCKADLQGTLDAGTIELLADHRKPMTVPDFLRGPEQNADGISPE